MASHLVTQGHTYDCTSDILATFTAPSSPHLTGHARAPCPARCWQCTYLIAKRLALITRTPPATARPSRAAGRARSLGAAIPHIHAIGPSVPLPHTSSKVPVTPPVSAGVVRGIAAPEPHSHAPGDSTETAAPWTAVAAITAMASGGSACAAGVGASATSEREELRAASWASAVPSDATLLAGGADQRLARRGSPRKRSRTRVAAALDDTTRCEAAA